MKVFVTFFYMKGTTPFFGHGYVTVRSGKLAEREMKELEDWCSAKAEAPTAILSLIRLDE